MSEQESLQPVSASQMKALEEAVSAYTAQLTPGVAQYLHGRGIDRETALTFRVGVAASPLPEHTRYAGFLAIPYLDKQGNPLSLRFRCLQEHNHREHGHGKYMSMADEPARTFNVKAVHDAGDEIHIAEGEFDAMVLTKVGLPAIAIPGAMGWRPHHRRMVAGFSKVSVWGDPDQAGADFVNKVTRAVRQARQIRLRDGDVTDTYLQGGSKALHALVEREESAS